MCMKQKRLISTKLFSRSSIFWIAASLVIVTKLKIRYHLPQFWTFVETYLSDTRFKNLHVWKIQNSTTAPISVQNIVLAALIKDISGRRSSHCHRKFMKFLKAMFQFLLPKSFELVTNRVLDFMTIMLALCLAVHHVSCVHECLTCRASIQNHVWWGKSFEKRTSQKWPSSQSLFQLPCSELNLWISIWKVLFCTKCL